jgi:hypothetical protein
MAEAIGLSVRTYRRRERLGDLYVPKAEGALVRQLVGEWTILEVFEDVL